MSAKPPPPAARFPATLERGAPTNASTSARDATLRPQRPLDHAARDARRQHRPSGVGLDSDAVRSALVQRLRRETGAHDAVCRAMLAVPRHRFVDSALAPQAYEDTSLPIGLQQTISKPSVVARMLSLLYAGAAAQAAGTLGRVLEIGTGCGYQTALLALLATRVVSIERLQALHAKARSQLDAVGVSGVRLIWGDGRIGHAPNAPYDSIVAAAGGTEVPCAWLEQLADGGRLVAPVADAERGQVLLVVDRRGDAYRRTLHEPVRFVPLESGLG